MSSFADADKEFNRANKVIPSRRIDEIEYAELHEKAKEKLLRKWQGKQGKGIDLELTGGIPVEVTILPSWDGNDFPCGELPLAESRIKRQNQWFAYFNKSLTKFALFKLADLGKLKPINGKYHIPLDKVQIMIVMATNIKTDREG